MVEIREIQFILIILGDYTICEFDLKNNFGVVYPQKMMNFIRIPVYFDHFWELCDGQHGSVGLLWRI